MTRITAIREDGKWLPFMVSGSVFVTNANINEVLTAAGGGWTLKTLDDEIETYDSNGRLVSIANRAGLTQTLAYDGTGRLSTVTDPFGRTLSFAYDSLNRIVSRSSTSTLSFGAEREKFPAPKQKPQLCVASKRRKRVGFVTLLQWPASPEVGRGHAENSDSLFEAKHLNTPRVVYDDQQRLRWKWEQDEPFGLNAPDENPSSLGVFEMSLRFPGQRHDAETGLAYNYFRDYDSSLGRYAQSDPIGLRGGLNTFSYVDVSPLKFVDPSGLQIVVPMPPPPIAGTNTGGSSNIARALTNLARKIRDYCSPQDADDSCQSHLTKCLESGWGGKVGFDSACFACFQRCQGNGEWPDSVSSGLAGQFPVSCEYWLKR